MNDIQPLLRRQAAWQRNRRHLSWPDKIHMVEALQKSLHQLKSLGEQRTDTPTDSAKSRNPEDE